jgi:hypothetical protein
MTNWNFGKEIKQKSQFEEAFLRKELKQPWTIYVPCSDSNSGHPTKYHKCKSFHREHDAGDGDDDDDDDDNKYNNNNNWLNAP